MRTIAGPKEDYFWPNYVRLQILDVGNASGRTLVCGNRPKGRLSLWPGHYIYYMIDIDNLKFGTNPIKG